MPRLSPGTYYASLFQARKLVQVPPAVTVQVTLRWASLTHSPHGASHNAADIQAESAK